MIARLAAIVLVLCLGAAACDSDGPPPVPHSASPTNVVTGPAPAGDTAYTLDLLDGAKTVQISIADLHGGLYRIATPTGSAVFPVAHVTGRTVNLTLSGGGDAELAITLARGRPWDLRFDAGVTTVSADMTGGLLAGLTAVQGVSTLDVTAPAPQAKVTLSELAGVSSFTLHTSDKALVRVLVGSGAGTVSLFGAVHQGVASGQSFDTSTTGPWSYTINAVGGVSSLTVDAATK